jgi:hypothetical protein
MPRDKSGDPPPDQGRKIKELGPQAEAARYFRKWNYSLPDLDSDDTPLEVMALVRLLVKKNVFTNREYFNSLIRVQEDEIEQGKIEFAQIYPDVIV